MKADPATACGTEQSAPDPDGRSDRVVVTENPQAFPGLLGMGLSSPQFQEMQTPPQTPS